MVDVTEKHPTVRAATAHADRSAFSACTASSERTTAPASGCRGPVNAWFASRHAAIVRSSMGTVWAVPDPQVPAVADFRDNNRVSRSLRAPTAQPANPGQ